MKTRKRKFRILGNWKLQSRQLRKEYSQLTPADLRLQAGGSDALVARIGNKLNKMRPEVVHILTNLYQRLAAPIRPLPLGTRKSNLLHDYYAVNSVDGRMRFKPLRSILHKRTGLKRALRGLLSSLTKRSIPHPY